MIYSGAKGKAPADLSGYLLTPKMDGCYSELATDDDGRIQSITLHSGRTLTGPLADAYLGIQLGAPRSLFAAELELFTEAANRHAQARGWRALYLFDLIALDGASLASAPYLTRYDALRAIRDAATASCPDKLPADATGRLHDEEGRFARDIPQAHRRYTVLPLHHPNELALLWARYVAFEKLGPCEGLVAIDPLASLGKRASKLKIKKNETIDCVVEMSSPTRAVVRWEHGAFSVGCKGLSLSPGQIVEVSFDGGFYQHSFIPRFPKILRSRPDLQGG